MKFPEVTMKMTTGRHVRATLRREKILKAIMTPDPKTITGPNELLGIPIRKGPTRTKPYE